MISNYLPLNSFWVNFSVARCVFGCTVIPILGWLCLQFAFALCLFKFMLKLSLLLITMRQRLVIIVNAVVIRRRGRVRAGPGGARSCCGGCGDFIGGEHGHELLIVKPIKLRLVIISLRRCSGAAAFVLHWRLQKCDRVADGSPVRSPPRRREVEEFINPTRVLGGRIGIAVAIAIWCKTGYFLVTKVRPIWGHVWNFRG